MGRPFLLSLGVSVLVACSEDPPSVLDPDAGAKDAGEVVNDMGAPPSDVVDAGPVDVARDVAVADAEADAGRACRTADDCTSPDLCDNAQACRFGRCVAVGGPAACDDAVACTDDACDRTMGRCTHVPNDMRCPGDNFCAVGTGCVRELPCEVGDTTCARLNGDPCTGTWSCEPARLRCVRSAAYNCADMDACTMDVCMVVGTAPMCVHNGPNYMTDLANCGACGRACSAGPNQTAACAAGACTATCAAGFVDADGMAANGCECNAAAPDAPDLMFRDSNCDGIDGDASRAVFVSPRGDDANPGTMAMPKRTMPAAITAAAAGAPVRAVYAAAGLYPGSVQLRSGIHIYGGYDDAAAWSRARTNATVIQGDATAVLAQDLTVATELQLVTVQSASAAVSGETSYGVRALNALLTLRGCTITSGNGASGANGADGAVGADGDNGTNGGTPGAGASGGSRCGAGGGRGGESARGGNNGAPGSVGSVAPGGAAAGNGGAAATRSGTCVGCVGACGGSAAANPPSAGAATAGSAGRNGANGGSAPTMGTVNGATGVYSGPRGVAGTAGAAGGGGGGGGAGTGGRTYSFPVSCSDHFGGGGGGGGGGGCGGGAGQGGNGGGGSFAVMSVSSTVRVDDCQMNAGRGGRGGAGGDGGDGGSGGNPGSGGGANGNAGSGGAGARGGAGGDAGSGSGGPGGPSVCVYYLGSAPMITGLTCVRGGGGTGGGGGRGGAGDAPDGATGFSEDVRAGM